MIPVEIISSGVRLNGQELNIGDNVEIEPALAHRWFAKQLAKPYKVGQKNGKEEDPKGGNESPDEELKHLGAGWYQLPNGEKIQGKKEALAELEKLKVKALEEGNDDSEADNSTK